MVFTPKLKASLVVLVMTGVLSGLWFKYSDFLAQGQKPPEEAVILNKIEKEGLPEFTIQDIQGQSVYIDKFKGKLVILNFWASWCDPCVAEFPSLLRLLKKFEGEIVLIAISADYEEADIHNFLKAFSAKDPNLFIAWDKNYEIAKKFGTFKLPESYIVGRKGELIRKVSGVDDWSSPDAYEFFEDLLKKK